MKCKGCGMLLADDVAVCELCGTPTAEEIKSDKGFELKPEKEVKSSFDAEKTAKIEVPADSYDNTFNPFESDFKPDDIVKDTPKKASYDPFAEDYAPTREQLYGKENTAAKNTTRAPRRSSSGQNNIASIVIAAAAIVIAIAVISVSIFFIVRESKGDEPAPVEVVQQVVEEENVKTDTVTPMINDFINSYVGQNDMSVAIIDNKTKEHYQSQFADSSFTAWGLYLPVYLAYGRYSGFDNSVREGIVSSDAGTSNNKANAAMRDMGGLGAVNDLLAQNFGVRGTTYGRYFGESNANSDNYTTASDAVVFLQTLSDANEYAKLSYNLGSFGITAPAGAAVYAHVGTENRNVRNDLNIFAIVKGENSDYCVTILSRNKSGRYISQLLGNIHAEMERN